MNSFMNGFFLPRKLKRRPVIIRRTKISKYIIDKCTLIAHVFNEEYLLPFWLEHHKDMFDEIVIIDYNSTDKSIEICKSICPQCRIIMTRNKYFKATDIDKEVMDIENSIRGIKIVLNITEFLICETTIKDIFIYGPNPMSYAVTAISPYSLKKYNTDNYYNLINNLLSDDVVYHYDRGFRQLHNYNNGNYTPGRHSTLNVSINTNKAYIIWFGFYPMNNNLLMRKLQIKQNMPKSDIVQSLGFQHLYNKNNILEINYSKSTTGTSLKNINLPLYDILFEKIINCNKSLPNYRAIILVLTCNLPSNKLYRNVWKHYMFRDDRFKVLFIYGKTDTNLITDYNKDYDIIAKKSEENLMIDKTLEAFKIIEKCYTYDYLIRTNSSTFWDFDKLHKHLDLLPTKNCYSGDGPLGNKGYNKNGEYLSGIIKMGSLGNQTYNRYGYYLSGTDTIVTPDMITSINKNNDQVCRGLAEDKAMGLYFNGVLGAPMLANRICFFEDINNTNQINLIRKRIDSAILNDKDHYRVKNLNGNRENLDKCVYKELLNKIYNINVDLNE